ncbi:MAG: twin-arginine translocation signal domain-containing protein, partial [Planctomycetes bacterium]|nr:twin-arginine translocation signal domain-containing protein [Planctomycetota bacterium]
MTISRRTFVYGAVAASGVSAVGLTPKSVSAAWPGEDAWAALRAKGVDRLTAVTSPLAPCKTDSSGSACAAVLKD